MGADRLCLFDKSLCDEIVGLEGAGMADFVERYLSRLGEFSIFRCGFDSSVPAGTRLSELTQGGDTEDSLRITLVHELCMLKPAITLDYWGCYIEAFHGVNPPGAISDLLLFPQQPEETFLLLRAGHLDQILLSLDDHADELSIMTADTVQQVREWRDFCGKHTDRMVAYLFD
jgi:hypothetical protein